MGDSSTEVEGGEVAGLRMDTLETQKIMALNIQ